MTNRLSTFISCLLRCIAQGDTNGQDIKPSQETEKPKAESPLPSYLDLLTKLFGPVAALSAITYVLGFIIYSVAVYPLIPPSFGGGAPVAVKLLVDAEESDYFSLLGIADSFAQTKAKALLTQPVMLVGKTDEQYLILVQRQTGVLEAATLDDEIVKGVLFPSAMQLMAEPVPIPVAPASPLPTETPTTAPSP